MAPKSAADARALARDIDAASGIPIFDYLEPYFSYRYVNFIEVADQFSCHGSIDTFIALLVDFDQPLGRGKNAETRSSIGDQTAVVSKICQLSQGRLLALAPYCPLKDAARNGASLANVRKAWKLPGFVGAKIYPPMGFKPYGNGGAVDVALDSFYSACVREDAVVMAHAGPSNCVLPGPCDFPGPPGWAAALSHVYDTQKSALRVGLGHFGGVLGSVGSSAHWPEDFVTHMKAPYGEHLYADLAYASEILDSSNDQTAVRRLTGLLTSAPGVLPERLMYGSDWLMLGLESQWRAYADRMVTVIDQVGQASGVQGFAANFFGTNARAWLGLDVATSLASRNTKDLHAS